MNHRHWLQQAAKVATGSHCDRAHCGSVIVANHTIIGSGFNAPPLNNPAHKRCSATYTIPNQNKHDLTCCVHAEIRAINDALTHHPGQLAGSTLYFTRVNETGEQEPAGEPYCTMCSRAALDAGISQFVLLHADGPRAYDTATYNDLSYAHYA